MSGLRWDAVTVAARDPEALAAFWCALLGVSVRGRWEQYVGLEPVAPGQPRLVLQGTADATPQRTTTHLDLHVASADQLAAEVERAVGLGASVVEQVEQAGQRWTVLADPEGNPFCLVAD